MSSAEKSTLWQRVSGLKVQLREHINIHRHGYRNQRWYVLEDCASNRYYRFSPRSYQWIRQFDGQRTLQSIWDNQSTNIDTTTSQEEIATLLGYLHSCDLIVSDASPNIEEFLARTQQSKTGILKKYIKSPLLIRIPVMDPDKLLTRIWSAISWFPGSLFIVFWFLSVLLATLLAAAYWPEISQYWTLRALAPYNLLLLLLTYPLIKALHEIAHGLAVKRWGGEVHETGIMLLVFMPIPYIDASASSAFRHKRQRILVSAAGILVELFLAAMATFVWITVETGLIRDIAYNVMLIGSLSTLLFNGNPLLRFDGYYILTDSIEIPNLSKRSVEYYGYLTQKYLFGISSTHSPANAAGENRWFLFYAPASTIYKLFILASITLMLAETYLIIGVLLAAYLLVKQIVYPILRHAQFVAFSPKLSSRRIRAAMLSTTLLCTVAAAMWCIPVPSSTYAQGVIWLAPEAQVRAETDGFIEDIVMSSQTEVLAETPLITMANPVLQSELDRLGWEFRALEASFNQQFSIDRGEAQHLQNQMRLVTADLENVQNQTNNLTIKSPTDGTYVASTSQLTVGRYVRKGDVLGFVVEPGKLMIRAAIPQSDVGQIRDQTRDVLLRISGFPHDTITGAIQHQVPLATDRLPSAALGTRGGGLITNNSDDATGLLTTDHVFLVDINLPVNIQSDLVGTRVHVRFKHDNEPIAFRVYRQVQQLLLRRLAA